MRLINKTILCFLAAGWLMVTGLPTAASEAPLHEVCRADIRHYCDTVTSGQGRIMACLYAHEDKISEDCDDKTDDVSAVLDSVFAKIEDILAECQPDIEKYCSDVKFGKGQILSCLKENSASVADACKAVVPVISGHLDD